MTLTSDIRSRIAASIDWSIYSRSNHPVSEVDHHDHRGSDMRRAKTHTGTFHCPTRFVEYELVKEESLKCEDCKGPLAEGSLDNVWEDEQDDEDEEDEDVEEDE